MTPLIDITLPIRTYSANHSEHWRSTYNRNKSTAKSIRLALAANSSAVALLLDNIRAYESKKDRNDPITQINHIHIEMTRIAPRELDEKDNLRMAFKHTADIISDWIIPGLQAGRADGSKVLTFSYKQEKGKPKEYGIRIRIYQKEFASQNET